jgi:hypothetical protein
MVSRHLTSYYIGISIVFVTHIFLLLTKNSVPVGHSLINLLAGILIAYYFTNKEEIINF